MLKNSSRSGQSGSAEAQPPHRCVAVRLRMDCDRCTIVHTHPHGNMGVLILGLVRWDLAADCSSRTTELRACKRIRTHGDWIMRTKYACRLFRGALDSHTLVRESMKAPMKLLNALHGCGYPDRYEQHGMGAAERWTPRGCEAEDLRGANLPTTTNASASTPTFSLSQRSEAFVQFISMAPRM